MENKETILKQLEDARLRVQQYENKIRLLQNRQRHLERKADKQQHIISAICKKLN